MNDDESTGYEVDLAELEFHFPPGVEVPQLLIDFGQWLRVQEDGSIGTIRFGADRIWDADLFTSFAFFLTDGSGGFVGFWLYEGETVSTAPVVFLGSEGELEIIADSLPEFLQRWAKGETGIHDLDDPDMRSKMPRPHFEKWLAENAIEAPSGPKRTHPDLTEWMDAWQAKKIEATENDPTYQAIAKVLRRYIPPDRESWESQIFDVLIVGSHFEMWHRSYGQRPVAEAKQLEPLFRKVRAERAQSYPDRGLWFYAWASVSRDSISISGEWLREPEFLKLKPSAADYRSDLRAAPRSDKWTPGWLAKLTGG